MMLKKIIWISSIVLLLLGDWTSSDGSVVKKRAKRYLSFIDNTKVFVRLNTKHNMVNETRIYAQATGFRVNYEIPKRKLRRFHRLHRREVYQNLEEMIMHHGFDGRACILRTLCEASKIVTPQSNILMKIFKKVFTIPKGDDQYFPYLQSEKCEILDEHCPMSLLELSKYTDDG